MYSLKTCPVLVTLTLVQVCDWYCQHQIYSKLSAMYTTSSAKSFVKPLHQSAMELHALSHQGMHSLTRMAEAYIDNEGHYAYQVGRVNLTCKQFSSFHPIS